MRRKKSTSTRTLAKKVRKIQNDQEVKQYQGVYTGITVYPDVGYGSGNWLFMNGSLDQGGAVTDRIGDALRLTSLMMKIRVTSDVDSLKTSLVRCMVFVDKQPNSHPFGSTDGTTPQLGNGYGPLITPDGSVNFLYAHYNPYTCGGRATRYKILYDKVWRLEPKIVDSSIIASSVTDTIGVVQSVLYKPLKIKLNKKVMYRRGVSTGTLADISTNVVWVVLISDSSTGEQPTALVSYKLNFKDN